MHVPVRDLALSYIDGFGPILDMWVVAETVATKMEPANGVVPNIATDSADAMNRDPAMQTPPDFATDPSSEEE